MELPDSNNLNHYERIYRETFKVGYSVVFAHNKRNNRIRTLIYNFVPGITILKNDFNNFVREGTWNIIKQLHFSTLREARLCATD